MSKWLRWKFATVVFTCFGATQFAEAPFRPPPYRDARWRSLTGTPVSFRRKATSGSGSYVFCDARCFERKDRSTGIVLRRYMEERRLFSRRAETVILHYLASPPFALTKRAFTNGVLPTGVELRVHSVNFLTNGCRYDGKKNGERSKISIFEKTPNARCF